jgi:hypothetical protein
MQFLRNNLPNLLTCLNLLCGLSGLILMAEYGIQAMPMLCILVFLAGVADFFDGFLARMLGSVSAIGKDLDSLADSVTFGVLPGMAAYFSLKEAGAGDLAGPDEPVGREAHGAYLWGVGGCVVSTLACTPLGRRGGEACLQMRRALQQGCRGPVLDTSTCQIRKDAKGAISEWPSYVIIKGDQWSSEVAITSNDY